VTRLMLGYRLVFLFLAASYLSAATAAACAPRDRTCILEWALTIDMEGYQSREIKDDTFDFADRAGKLLALAPTGMRDSIRKRWIEAADNDRFEGEMEGAYYGNLATSEFSIEALRTALETRTAPAKIAFGDYVKVGFDAVWTSNPQVAQDLWFQNIDLLISGAPAALTQGHQWLANNNVAGLERYHTQYYFPQSTLYNPWETLGRAADQQCRNDNKPQGERILKVMEVELEARKDDAEKRAMRQAKLMPAIISCRTETAARQWLDLVLSQLKSDLEAAKANYSNEGEQKFVLGVITSEVSESLTGPFALWLNKQGRHDDAMTVFSRLPAQGTLATLGDMQEKGILGLEFPAQQFDAYIAQNTGINDRESKQALTFYLDGFDGTWEPCCDKLEYPFMAIHDIEALWPDDIAKRAATRSLEHMRMLTALKLVQSNRIDEGLLQLAILQKQREGCLLTADFESGLLSQVQSYGYYAYKVDTLIRYIQYLDTKPVARTASPCIIQ
jgi:hypothetical protein